MRLTYFHHLCEGDTALHHVRQFVDAARGLGHEVDVHPLDFSRPRAQPLEDRRGSRVGSRSWYLLRYLLHEPKKVIWNLPSFRRASQALDQTRSDVVLVRSELLTLAAVLAARRADLPVVLEVNSPTVESSKYLDQYLHLPFLPEAVERARFRLADAVTVVSSALRDFFVERHRVDAEKFSVVPNGADISKFQPGVLPDPELAEMLSGEVVVGFVGSFEKWHGPEILRDMVLEVTSARPTAHFLLVGDGPGRGTVQEELASVADRVTFTGRVSHERIPGITALIDVAVMPESNFYGSPLKVIEWMAAGRAIVAPDYGPLAEVIESGKEGLLFRHGQVDDLVSTVIDLIGNEDLRLRLGVAAYKRAVGSLSWSHNAERVILACEKAIDRHDRKSRGFK